VVAVSLKKKKKKTKRIKKKKKTQKKNKKNNKQTNKKEKISDQRGEVKRYKRPDRSRADMDTVNREFWQNFCIPKIFKRRCSWFRFGPVSHFQKVD